MEGKLMTFECSMSSIFQFLWSILSFSCGIIFRISIWQYCQSLIQIFTTTCNACIKLNFRWNLSVNKGVESIHLNIAECIGCTYVALHTHSPWRHVLGQHCSHDNRTPQSSRVGSHFVWAVGECCRLFQVFVLHHFWSTLRCGKDVGPSLHLYCSK